MISHINTTIFYLLCLGLFCSQSTFAHSPFFIPQTSPRLYFKAKNGVQLSNPSFPDERLCATV